MLRVSREKLMAALYPQLSLYLYYDFMELRYSKLSHLGTDEFADYYDSMDVEGDNLFRIVTQGGEAVSTASGILLSPVRGILSVLAVIGGLAVSLYSIRDEREGCFNMIPERKRFGVYVIYNLIAVFDIATVSLAALAISGLSAAYVRELVLLLAFVFSAVAFSTFLRVVFAKENVFGVLIPLAAVLLITLCPVFININMPIWLRLLMPPYGYIAGVYSSSVLLPWIGISCAFYVAAYALFTLRLKWLRKILG